MDQPVLFTGKDTVTPLPRKAIIIGAGPAGLTAAYELLKRSDIIPVILEKSGDIGGISKTINYKGNRMDIGGHRFFSKSDRVMNWWLNILPVQDTGNSNFSITYQNKSREVIPGQSIASGNTDKVMLVRQRLSRIYFLRKFFTYPIQLSLDTLQKLGVGTTISILVSYLKAQASPRKPEKSLEDFMINRFGSTLYNLFFKDYTEKVWGVPCHEIPAEWGAQRIKGVSIRKAIQHAVQSAMKKKKNTGDISQKDTETSLIEQFLYPKLGPGQLWEEVARQVKEMGGIILMQHDVVQVNTDNEKVVAIEAFNKDTLETVELKGDYFFSTMPVKELVANLDADVPANVKEVASGLQYRDFITVGILLQRLSAQDKRSGKWKELSLKDTWIYIQEKEVTVGRLQLFNNWSPFLVKDPGTVWVGMEFFCNETDNFWKLPDAEISALAISELAKIGLANATDVLDSTVLRVEKTYPAYFGAYDRFEEVKEYINKFPNLFLVGRNGMHKYNNADHSMLTAMVAVDNIIAGVEGKDNIWSINTEQEYHEEKAASSQATTPDK
jgi:protoporphyrinogen oxidase